MSIRIRNRESVTAGKASWHQIEVSGLMAYNYYETQIIDDVALGSIVASFGELKQSENFAGMLVDADHLSHYDDHNTEAYGWLQDVKIGEDDNGQKQLLGLIEWTDIGAEAVEGKRWKYFSTEYGSRIETFEDGGFRPLALDGLSLTNRPRRKGGKPISNRSGTGDQTQPKPTMSKLNEALGLNPDATEQDGIKAVQKLKTELATIKNKAAEAEADSIMNRYSDRIPEQAKPYWRERLIANREETEKAIEVSFPKQAKQEPKPAFTNRQTAKTPDHHVGGSEDQATERARAARIRNRAAEIQKTEGIQFSQAWQRAEAEEV